MLKWSSELSFVLKDFPSPTEQYAVSELMKASRDAQDIDGEVLNYLELAQVFIMHSIPNHFLPLVSLSTMCSDTFHVSFSLTVP